MTEPPVPRMTFNIVKQRGDPKTATLESGHVVRKQDTIFFKDEAGKWQMVKPADYHTAHFLYLDPVFNQGKAGMGHWFAMCTCGAPAVLVGPQEARLEESDLTERLLVCSAYHTTLVAYGIGRHQGGDGRRWA